MNNNIIRLEDFKNKSLDDIIELYTYGFRLENSYTENQHLYQPIYQPQPSQPSQLSQPSIQKLQTMPSLSLLVAGILLAGIAAGATLILLSRMDKNK